MTAPSQPQAPPPSLWQRRATRRALLAGTASVAAAGTAAAIVGFAQKDGGGSISPAADEAARHDVEGQVLQAPTTAPLSSKKGLTDAKQRAAHLLRRAGFGGSMADIEAFALLSKDAAADRLLNYETVDNSALDARIANAAFILQFPDDGQQRGRLIQDMQRWWLTRMAYSARPLEERMTFIWHGLLTSQISKVGQLRARWLFIQNELYRKNALGRFDDLIQAVSKDPAMLSYLDTIESTREHPNENYARELMELYTMGEGNYTEMDIRESARAFTGWRLTAPPRPTAAELNGLTEQQRRDLQQKLAYSYTPEYMFQARLHDAGSKTFLGRSGNWNGEDIVRIIMEQPATGRFVTARLWREFAYDNPEPEIVDRLVKVWDSSGHSVRSVVRTILTSDEFYSEKAYFGKVRSPIELLTGLVRGLELDTTFQNAGPGGRGGGRGAAYYAGMDQVLFEPPNVAGWSGGTSWLSSSTFFARVNFLDQVLFNRGRPLPVPALSSALTAEAVVDGVAARLIDATLRADSRAAIVAHLNTVRDPQERAATAAYLIAGSPEFQVI